MICNVWLKNQTVAHENNLVIKHHLKYSANPEHPIGINLSKGKNIEAFIYDTYPR